MVHQRSLASFKTPLGWAGVAATEEGVCLVVLPRRTKQAVEAELNGSEPGVRRSECGTSASQARLEKAISFLQRYFSGKPVHVGLALDLRDHTVFQQAVWKAASDIPYGETRSYVWVAQRIKNPGAVRAVGRALGANPVPVLVPCHRVITASGALGGFSGGRGMKERLLMLERHDNKRR